MREHLQDGTEQQGTATLEATPFVAAIRCVEAVAHDLTEGIEAVGQHAKELVESAESSRIAAKQQCDDKVEALEEDNKEQVRKLHDELDQRVLDRTAELEAANEELDAFSYSVSHDLRAPLRAIDGFARILQDDYFEILPAAGKQCLDMVRQNAAKMRQLVEGLLAFSRLSLQPPVKASVDLNQMVGECLRDMATEQPDRAVELVVGDMPPCMADPVLLRQVWTNLLSNAFKYTRKQGSPRIEIGSRSGSCPPANGLLAPVRTAVVYFVKDNGVGFDMKHVDKLFGVFQRLPTAADFEGTGAGLAIAQRIVQRHGGQIWGEGTVNEGATFSFTLG